MTYQASSTHGSTPKWPGLAAAAGDRRKPSDRQALWVWVVLLAVLELADIVTTNLVLRVPGAIEANPIMAAAQLHLGSLWWLPKAAVVLWFAFAATGTRRPWPIVCAVSFCALAVAINLANLVRAA